MSTYLQGVTDTGIEPIQFSPAFPYYQQSLASADQKYDQGMSKLAGAYSNIYNADLTNNENQQARAQYVSEVKNSLQKITKTDLSVQSNVDAASKLFSPFWEDNDIIQDYAKTKLVKQEVQRANSLQGSSDKAERMQYWEPGVSYVNQTLQELQLAKRGDGSIAKVESRKYVPYVDVMGEMNQALKEQGFNVKTATTSNGYIITTENGEGSKAIYEDVAARLINQHPEWREVFKVQGTTQFYGSVLNYQQRFGVDEQTARQSVAKAYQDEQISSADKEISRLTNNGAGLQSSYEAAKAKVLKGNGAIPEDVKQMQDLYQQLQSNTAAIGYYNKAKEDFSGDDFLNQVNHIGGERYFANKFEQSFIKDFARVKADNVQQSVSSDPTYVAAQTQANERYMLEQKLAHSSIIDTDGDGIPDAKITRTVDANGNLVNAPSGGVRGAKASLSGKAATGLTPQQILDIPTDAGIYGKQGSAASGSSLYNNLVGSVNSAGESFVNSGTSFVASVSNFYNKYSGLGSYLDNLSSLIRTGNHPKGFDENQANSVYQSLIKDGVIPPNIDNTNTAPSLQLKALVDAAHTYAIANNTNKSLSEAQKNFRLQYQRDGQTYYYGNQLLTKFKDEVINTNSALLSTGIIVKGKDNKPKLVSEDEWVKAHTPTTEKVDVESGADMGFSITRGTKVVMPIPAERYNILLEQNRKKYKETLDKANTALPTYLAQHVPGQDGTAGDIVMSRMLNFKTDNDGAPDIANKIATAVISDRTRNMGEHGVIKPLNIEQLTANSSNSDIRDILNYLTESGSAENFNKVISSVDITSAGRNGNPVAIFRVDREKLYKLLDHTSYKDYTKAITALTRGGVELEMDKNQYNAFAADNYVPKAVDKAMIAGGLKASDWEKENLHYDYAIQKGPGGNNIVTMKLKKINPQTNTVEWADMDEGVTFPESYPVSEILKMVEQLGYQNSVAINNYYTQQRQAPPKPATPANPNPTTKLPGETDKDYIARLEKSFTK